MSKDIVSLIAAISHDDCKKDRDRVRCLLEQYRFWNKNKVIVVSDGERICENHSQCDIRVTRMNYKCCSKCDAAYCLMNEVCPVHNIIHNCAGKMMMKLCRTTGRRFCKQCIDLHEVQNNFFEIYNSVAENCKCETCEYIKNKIKSE